MNADKRRFGSARLSALICGQDLRPERRIEYTRPAIDMNMLKDIVEARPLEQHRLYLRFEDGVEGTVDLKDLIRFEGVFAPLQHQTEFERVYVDPELGTICWPNGADLDPVVLYARVTGQPIPFQVHESKSNEDRLAS
jgi:hypothetical protein